MIHLERHPAGPRVYVLGQRVHHGAVGVALAGLGVLLSAHDRSDLREWFARADLNTRSEHHG